MIEEQVEQALAALIAQDAPKHGKRTELRAAVEKHRDTIQRALTMGWPATKIACAIHDSGVPVGIGTIREYVVEVGGAAAKRARKKPRNARKNTPEVIRESLPPEDESAPIAAES